MKISVFYDHILQACEQSGKGELTVVREAAAAGISGVELRLEYLQNNPITLEYIGDAGMNISCLYEFYDMAGCDERAHAMRHINVARLVGAKNILVVPGFLDEKLWAADYDEYCKLADNCEQIGKMISVLRFMVEYASDKGVNVTVEDFDDERSPVSAINGVRYFLERVPGLGHTLDCGNYAYSDEDVLNAYELFGDFVTHVHLKDRGAEDKYLHDSTFVVNKGLASVATGEGYLPIKEIITLLKKRGYEGYYAIEHFDAPDQRECIKRSAEFLGGI